MSPYLIAGAGAALLCAWIAGCNHGTAAEHDRRVAEVASLRQVYADAARSVAEDSIARLQAATLRGDLLTTRLQAADAALQTQKTETDRAIQRYTTGRVCLSADAVRVLNISAAESAGDHDGRMPYAPGSTAAADAAGAATDTDVGLWASDARTRYRQCAERLDALIDWHIAPVGCAPRTEQPSNGAQCAPYGAPDGRF